MLRKGDHFRNLSIFANVGHAKDTQAFSFEPKNVKNDHFRKTTFAKA